MEVLFQCPSCAEQLAADESAHGQTVSCPKCAAVMIVPQRHTDVPARRTKLVVGIALAIVAVAAVVAVLAIRHTGKESGVASGSAAQAGENSGASEPPANATPVEQVRFAAQRL